MFWPSDPLRPRQADEHFDAEATAAREAGVSVALVDHHALADPGEAGRAAASVPDSGGIAVYRGWMLRASQHAVLAPPLAARSVALRASDALDQDLPARERSPDRGWKLIRTF
ncbi:MAG: hypothetical protein ACRDOI_23205 [Trebonia sp.]